MAIPPQDIAFAFGAVAGATGRKHLRVGELVLAENFRTIVDNEGRKRPGFERLVLTADSGAFTGTAESLTSDGAGLISRDGNDTAWLDDPATLNRYNKGRQQRAIPKEFGSPVVSSPSNPTLVVVGATYWLFHLVTNGYRFTIFEQATGRILRAATAVTATGVKQYSVSTDGTTVAVLWVTGASATVTCHRLTVASPGTAPTSTTYQTTTGNAGGIDQHRLANGDIAVATSENGNPAATSARIIVSYLDMATGLPKVSPAAVTTAINGAPQTFSGIPCPPSILVSDGSNGSWYLALWWKDGQTVNTAWRLALATITASTLATAITSANVDSITIGAGDPVTGLVSGYRDTANGNLVLFYSTDSATGTPSQPRPWTLKRAVWTGSAALSTLGRYAYIASKPVLVGSSWYIVTGFDDGDTANLQRSYYVRDSDGSILDQLLYQTGGAAAPHQPSGNTPAAANSHVAALLSTQSNRIDIALLQNTGGGVGSAYAPTLVAVDLAANYSAPSRFRDRAVAVPGGVPVRVGSQDNARELCVMQFPMAASFTAGSGTPLGGLTQVQVTFRLPDADGTITESSPSIPQSTTFNNGTGQQVIVRSLTHLLSGAKAQIAVYLSVVGQTQPFLHAIVDNDPTVDTIAIAVTPATVATNETLYTFGGALSNATPPRARAIWTWANRLFLATNSEIWCSQEFSVGLGPKFNEVLSSRWNDGEGDILAGCPIDADSCALFKTDTIGVISGSGPDNNGAGNYVVRTCRAKKGLINVRSLTPGPNGAYFQSRADGRIYSVTPAAEVVDVSSGMEAYRGLTITAARWRESDRILEFFTPTGILVLDYAHPTDTQPNGRWYFWKSSALLQGYGAALDPMTGVAYHLEAGGTLRRPGTGWQDASASTPADVLLKLKTGDLAGSGALGGSYRLSAVHFDGQALAPTNLLFTVDCADGIVSEHPAQLTSGPAKFSMPIPDAHRVASTSVTIEETSAGDSEGLIADYLILTVQPLSRARPIPVNQIVGAR